jgi:hypothetical protein
MDLLEGLNSAISNSNELLKHYENLGPFGTFGAGQIKRDIAEAEKAIDEGNIVDMITMYEALQRHQ